jgi:single-stranded DNA-binding protein
MSSTHLTNLHRYFITLLIAALLASALMLPQTAQADGRIEAHTNQVASTLWLGEYYNNVSLSGAPAFRRYTRSIAFNWGRGSPSRAISSDNFSVRWTRTLNFGSGVYRFRAVTDDGVRVWVGNTALINAWTDGPSRVYEADIALSGLQTVRVEYYERTELASIRLSFARISTPPGSEQSWRAEYFNNLTLEGSPSLVRQDAQINFDWGNGAPSPQVLADGFSVRWTRRLSGIIPGNYNIVVRVDDGVRVFVDGSLVINEWRDGAPRNVGANVALNDGSTVRVEYYDRSGSALIQLSIIPASAPAPAPVPSATPAPVNYPNWRAEYYNNTDLSGSPAIVRNDIAIDFDWGTGSPDGRVRADQFSARWTGRPTLAPGNYRVNLKVDDGARVYINGALLINEWRDGAPRDVSADFSVGSSFPEVRVEYYERDRGALIQVTFTDAPQTFSDWKAEYFNNADQSGSPAVIRNDTAINFDWGGGSPDGRVNADNFSVRWSRRQNFGGGTYRIEATIDDGMRVYVDGQLLINEWRDNPLRTVAVIIPLTAGDHDLRVDYYERGGGAIAKLNITRVTVAPSPTPTLIAPSATPAPQPTQSPTLTPIP